MKYKITSFSFWWPKVETFFVDTAEEKNSLVAELKDQQFKVEWEEIKS